MTITVDIQKDIAIVYVARKPVNALDLALWKQLTSTLYDLEMDLRIRGLILISGLQRAIFSAG